MATGLQTQSRVGIILPRNLEEGRPCCTEAWEAALLLPVSAVACDQAVLTHAHQGQVGDWLPGGAEGSVTWSLLSPGPLLKGLD